MWLKTYYNIIVYTFVTVTNQRTTALLFPNENCSSFTFLYQSFDVSSYWIA
jgi:hypothetical protein